MNLREWLTAKRKINEEFYEVLVGEADCGPFDGGCVVVAQALQRVIGGEIVVLIRPDDTADHAAVLQDGKLWDYDGPLRPAKFVARFIRTELRGSTFTCSGYRPIREVDLPDAYRNAGTEARLEALFRSALKRDLQVQIVDSEAQPDGAAPNCPM